MHENANIAFQVWLIKLSVEIFGMHENANIAFQVWLIKLSVEIFSMHENAIYHKQLECSCTNSPGQDASPSQVSSQQCWYSFAAEYTEANQGK